MNNDQLKYIADAAKMVATAQFGYYGYTALQSGDRFWVILSAILFVNIIYFGVEVLSFIEEKK